MRVRLLPSGVFAGRKGSYAGRSLFLNSSRQARSEAEIVISKQMAPLELQLLLLCLFHMFCMPVQLSEPIRSTR